MVLAHHLYEIVHSHRKEKIILTDMKSSFVSDSTSPELNEDENELDEENEIDEKEVDDSNESDVGNETTTLPVTSTPTHLNEQDEQHQQQDKNHEVVGLIIEEIINEIHETSEISRTSTSAESLRALFEARDVALNKLIQSTSLLTLSTSSPDETNEKNEKNESSNSSDGGSKSSNSDSSNGSVRCISCQQLIPCTFLPLQSAAAKYRKQQTLNNEESIIELEPKYTNWTSDYIG